MHPDESFQQWYKQFWPWFIILLPASVVVAGIITVVIAFKHEDSLVSSNYYRDGLAINRQLTLEKNAVQRALKATLAFDQNTGEIRVAVTGDFQTMPSSLLLQLSHPTDQHQDVLLALKQTPHNDYLGQLLKPLSGRWYIQLSDVDQQRWRINAQIDFHKQSRIEFAATGALHNG